MVRNALESIKNLDYENWELAFIDDGSLSPGKPIVEEILKDHLNKITCINTEDSIADKSLRGGSNIGLYMNQAVESSDADISIMLCDDDALVFDYFSNLDRWFTDNPEKKYCYSHVILFDPFLEKPDKESFNTDEIVWTGHKQKRYKNRYNKTKRHNPENSLDSSQVAWRISNKEKHISFPFPQTANLDATFYSKLNATYGPAVFSGFTGQYKGHHKDNLCLRDQEAKGLSSKNKSSTIFSIKDLSSVCENE